MIRIADRITSGQQAELLRLLRELEPEIRISFIRAIRDSVDSIDFDALIRALRVGNIEAAVREANIDGADLNRVASALRTVAYRAATDQAVLAQGAVEVRGGAGLRVNASAPSFDAAVSSAVRVAIAGISEESAEALRRVIARRIAEGASAEQIVVDIVGRRVGAQRVGGVLGLTEPLAASVIAAEEDLRSGTPSSLRRYLSRKLRDKRFDRTVRTALETRRPISPERIAKMVEAHKAKAIGWRGLVIARTEAARMAAIARHEGWRQALEDGTFRRVSVEWRHNGAAEPRLDHVAMSGTIVEFGRGFVFPDGVVMQHPHDPSAPARHVINCGCTAIYRPEG